MMKQKIKMAFAYSCALLILGTVTAVWNLWDISINRKIEANYVPVQAHILDRRNVSWDWSYYKMRLYVAYSAPDGQSYTAWVQMPVSSHRYPQEYTEVYIDPRLPDEPAYPAHKTGIIIGWVFAGTFYTLGIIVFGYHMLKKTQRIL